LRHQITNNVLQFIPANQSLLPTAEVLRPWVKDKLQQMIPEEENMTEEMETKTTEVQEDDDRYINRKNLILTSSQAMLLSWLFLAVIVLFVINLIIFLLSVAGVQFQGAIVTINQMIGNLSTQLLLIAVAGFFFVFLRAISEGLYMLMDLGDEVSKIGKELEK
jgi:6-pyruvoyl-tetrahydropterin synthase